MVLHLLIHLLELIHVDALGVIAVGVGGLEAENVMLGNPSYMRVPEIIGVEITGTRGAGITATDIALSLTSFLRDNNVISAYLEFYGSGIKYLDLGDRATISMVQVLLCLLLMIELLTI